MEVEDHPVKAQDVARRGRHVVDANSTVDVLDPVDDGADVNVGYRRPVPEVHRYARRGAETLSNKKNKNPRCHPTV